VSQQALSLPHCHPQVFKSFPILAAWPLIPIGINVGLIFYTAIVAAFIWTGEETPSEDYQAAISLMGNSSTGDELLSVLGTTSAERRKYAMLVFHLIGCLWLYYFVNACAWTTYAGVGARWFFSHENGKLEVGFWCGGLFTMLDSAWCVISRHLGTMAFGSLIMTIVQALRIMCEIIDRYTKNKQASNHALKMAIKCIKCCLACLYQTIKAVTNYGYIFTAVEGKNLCAACWSTFSLMARNPSQVLVNAMVGTILEVLIKLSIPIACALLGFTWCEAVGSAQPTYPAVFMFISSLIIASGVGDTFRCMVDTIFVCAWKDMQTNKPAYFMSESLQHGFGIKHETNPDEVSLVM